MTAATAILGLIFLVALCSGLNFQEEEQKCVDKLHPSAELLAQLNQGKYDKLKDLPEAKEFIVCYQEILGVMKDGKIDAGKTKEVVSGLPTDKGVSLQKRNKTIDDCSKVAEEKKEKTNKAFTLYQCYFKALPNDLSPVFPVLLSSD